MGRSKYRDQERLAIKTFQQVLKNPDLLFEPDYRERLAIAATNMPDEFKPIVSAVRKCYQKLVDITHNKTLSYYGEVDIQLIRKFKRIRLK